MSRDTPRPAPQASRRSPSGAVYLRSFCTAKQIAKPLISSGIQTPETNGLWKNPDNAPDFISFQTLGKKTQGVPSTQNKPFAFRAYKRSTFDGTPHLPGSRS